LLFVATGEEREEFGYLFAIETNPKQKHLYNPTDIMACNKNLSVALRGFLHEA